MRALAIGMALQFAAAAQGPAKAGHYLFGEAGRSLFGEAGRFLFGETGPALSLGLFVVSLAAGVGATGRKAWSAARVGSLDINVLMIIAALGAALLGDWAEAATVVFLFGLAQALEARTLDRARHAIRALMDLTPADALLRDSDGERRVPVDQVAIGAVIVVRPGEKIPLDGDVIAGQSAVNQAPVTGESLPADKAPGDGVFAGTINGRGALDVRVTRLRRDTTLARIIHLVERAQSQRAPAQTLIERFARVYTPAVIVLAAAIAVVPPLLFQAGWDTWLYRALVLLVVSCPCALVISTPVSIVAALAGAARKGVLIKGGVHLENTSKVRCVAFDKTGTLTRGTPQVVEVVRAERRGCRLDRLACGVGRATLHASHRPGDPRSRHIGRGSGATGGRGPGAGRARRGRAGRRRIVCSSATIACSRSGACARLHA